MFGWMLSAGQKEQFGAVDHGMHAVLKCLHGRERLERRAEKNHCSVPPLPHGHSLERLEREIFADVVRGKRLLHDHNLVSHLAETHGEIAVCCGGMHLVTQVS